MKSSLVLLRLVLRSMVVVWTGCCSTQTAHRAVVILLFTNWLTLTLLTKSLLYLSWSLLRFFNSLLKKCLGTLNGLLRASEGDDAKTRGDAVRVGLCDGNETLRTLMD